MPYSTTENVTFNIDYLDEFGAGITGATVNLTLLYRNGLPATDNFFYNQNWTYYEQGGGTYTMHIAIENLTAFLSMGRLSGAQVAERYWERKEESDAQGNRVLRLHCATKIAINKASLERQLRDATTVRGGNPEIREKLLQAQKDFIEGVGEERGVGSY